MSSAERVFKPQKNNSQELASLQETITRKDSVIAQITEENLLLKKNPSAVWALSLRKGAGK